MYDLKRLGPHLNQSTYMYHQLPFSEFTTSQGALLKFVQFFTVTDQPFI